MLIMGAPSLLPDTDARVRRARARVRSYHARGMTFAHMAKQTGLSYRTLSHIHYRNGGMRRCTLVALARMQFEEPEPTARVNPVGTRRRLMALWADGFPTPWVAERLDTGWPRQYLRRVAVGAKGAFATTYSTHRAVAELYEKLAEVDPFAEAGITKVGRSKARAAARRQGLPGRACWDSDTIDDPEAIPQWTGHCGTPLGRYVHARDGIPLCGPCREADRIKQPVELKPGVLARRRAQLGWSLDQLREHTGKEGRTIYSWEIGKHKPRLEPLEQVLNAYDLLLEDVLLEEEYETGSGTEG